MRAVARPGRRKGVLVRLEWPSLGGRWQGNVQRKSLGMLIRHMKCVPEVHLEGVAALMQAILDELRGELGAVKQVCCRNT
jgi:hypothetical protein